MLTQMVYISTATHQFTDNELAKLLKQSRQNNVQLVLQPQLGRLQQMSDLLPGNAVARGRRFEPFTTAPPEPA